MDGHIRLISLSSILVLVTACGARTGLLDEGSPAADSGPEIHGDFPCNYSRSGDLVHHYLQPSYSPDLAWGSDMLAIVKTELDSNLSTNHDLGICISAATLNFADCVRFAQDRSVESQGAQVVWDGEAFGVCWDDHSSSRATILWQRFHPDGLTPEPAAPMVISDEPGPCRELLWAGDRYIATVGGWDSFRVISFDREGGALDDELLNVPVDSLGIKFDIAADEQRAVAAWASPDGIWVTGLRGFSENEYWINNTDVVRHLSIALRGSQAGILWTNTEIARYRIFLTVLDLESGELGQTTSLGSVNGVLFGLDISAVAEGFIVAWSEQPASYVTQREVFIPTRVHDGLTVEVREENVIYEERMHSAIYGSAPSLLYDGLNLLMGITVYEEEALGPQVLLQRISCHR